MQVHAAECIAQFGEVLTACNIGKNGLNVGGRMYTECGFVSIDGGQIWQPSESEDAILAARNIYPDGCNPPVWSACSPNEKSALLNNACDYVLCLKAGNCAPC